jgi:Mg2+-importing ATPase
MQSARSDPVDLDWAAAHEFAEVLDALGSTPTGLTAADAADRLREHGPNVLAERSVTAWDVLVRQLRNPLLILLLGAAAVSAGTGGVTDAVIIAVIVFLSVGLGFVNEYRSEQAVAALHQSLRHEATVSRDGAAHRIDVRELVVGDVIDLHLGDLIPADARLLVANQLECDEAVLTGESMPAVKSADLPTANDTTAHDTTAHDTTAHDTTDGRTDELGPRTVVSLGTIVHQGSGRAVVVATGAASAFGRIAAGLAEQQGETAFQKGLRAFSGLLVKVAAVLTTSIFVINLVLHRPFIDALLFSLAIAIGITPQLLPAIVSLSLATGSRQLAARKVLVKRLVTIEDLGNIELLFTDKTGTLTEGAITFDSALDPAGTASDQVVLLGLLCDEAEHTAEGALSGSPLDVALWNAPHASAEEVGRYTRLDMSPFDHERQMASALVRSPDDTVRVIAKGAPEAVLSRCADVTAEAQATLDALFADGARVVAVASRPATGTTLSPDDEHDLHLDGFLTFVDRPKADAGQSIARLQALGIDVKIITGDNGTVGAKVCRDLGMTVAGVLTGADVAAMDDAQLLAAIATTTVFARVKPEQKSRIVRVARTSGADVAFMGDGVNDAVALHAADVGISVDSATDVAKDAADIVLLDKDLGVLADGVMEGRRIFANTLKYVLMATSSNFGNMFSAAGASLFLTFLPMLPSQILLNNLLYDMGQLAIPTDEVDPEQVARPSAWDISFVRRFMITFGPVSSLFDFMTFFVMLGVLHANHAEFRSGWFVESLATQTLVIFLIRTKRIPFFRSRPSKAMLITPTACALVGAALPFTPLAGPLGFTTLPISFFLILLAMILAYLVLVEFAKQRFYAHQPHPDRTKLTNDERHEHRLRRRGHRFVVHTGPGDVRRTTETPIRR